MRFLSALLGVLTLVAAIFGAPYYEESSTILARVPGLPLWSKRAAPLDPNAVISGTLATLSSLVGVLGSTVSKAVMGLTGIGITDCAGQLPANVNSLPCEEFLDALSQCDSLANVKPSLQKAKKSYRKKPNKKAPCTKNKKSKKSKKA